VDRLDLVAEQGEAPGAIFQVRGEKLDIVAAGASTGVIDVLLGNGAGGFSLTLVPWSGAYSVALGDANGDGIPRGLVPFVSLQIFSISRR